jgi:cytochrome c-type biogenesis protein CcmH
MSERIGKLARLGVTLALAAFVIGSVVTAPAPAADRVESIGRQIKCPICSGESIADSPSGLAEGMMGMVRDLVDQGYTDEQVIDEVLAAYGTDAQLLDPGVTARTAALWAVPLVALIAGMAAALTRRRARITAADSAPAPRGTAPREET